MPSPDTGATIEFQRGDEDSALVQIDHVVALADAWRSGAWQWDAQRRQEFANDPENLLAVDGQANEDKVGSVRGPVAAAQYRVPLRLRETPDRR